ncbi:MAG: DUF6163 family protein [Alphaproteobacteria bacterium]
MASIEDISARTPERNRFEVTLDYYLIGLSVMMMLLGLRHWAIIIGVLSSGEGSFEAMSTQLKFSTMYFAVFDLLAAVGLWLRAVWGRVVFALAAVSEITLHTVFINTFGVNLTVIMLLTATLLVFAGLVLAAHRAKLGEEP